MTSILLNQKQVSVIVFVSIHNFQKNHNQLFFSSSLKYVIASVIILCLCFYQCFWNSRWWANANCLPGCFKSISWEFKNFKIAHLFARKTKFNPECQDQTGRKRNNSFYRCKLPNAYLTKFSLCCFYINIRGFLISLIQCLIKILACVVFNIIS